MRAEMAETAGLREEPEPVILRSVRQTNVQREEHIRNLPERGSFAAISCAARRVEDARFGGAAQRLSFQSFLCVRHALLRDQRRLVHATDRIGFLHWPAF